MYGYVFFPSAIPINVLCCALFTKPYHSKDRAVIDVRNMWEGSMEGSHRASKCKRYTVDSRLSAVMVGELARIIKISG
jgi:hypothetical protein